MTTDENKKLIRQLILEAMNGRNLSVIDQLVAPAFVNHGIPDAKKGPHGFKEAVQQFIDAFPDMMINMERIISEGDIVATQGFWTGTNKGSFMGMPATQKPVRVYYCDFWKIQNGKCVENWVQMDMAGMMQQLGVTQEMHEMH